jgi:ABC-type transport system involved in multi-copper enzyme maturation permease subunit
MILGWLSMWVGILFVGVILFLALFNKYDISFLTYLETNQQIFTNGFILIAIGVYISSLANQNAQGDN